MKEKKRVFSIDCETLPFDGKRVDFSPLIWGIYEGETKVFNSFLKTADCVAFIKQNPGYYYAHNGGKFDWFFLTDQIQANFSIVNGKLTEIDERRMLFINGRLVQFFIGESIMRDSWPLFPVPLRVLGDKTIFDYNKLNSFSKHQKEITEYLKQDCVVLFDAIKTFHETYGIHLTIPSAALAQWRKMSGHKSGEYTTNDSGYDSLHRSHYFGGRCESFVKGEYKKPFAVFDINSAYPYAMLHSHPWGYDTIACTADTLPGNGFISLTCDSTGAFPFRELDGSTGFPNDKQKRRFDITGWEYNTAVKLGMVHNATVIKCWRHLQTISFLEYVNHFYALKNASKKESIEYVCAKLFLNSLYGKFGQNWTDFSEYITATPECPPVIEMVVSDELGETQGEQKFYFQNPMTNNLGLYEADKFDGKFLNVAIAASITGFVRAYLLEHISVCKNPLYCDTDSIACQVFNGTIGTQLGEWKKEGEFSSGHFAGKKLYCFHGTKGTADKIASKGVRLTRQDFAKLVEGKQVSYTPQAPSFSCRTGKAVITTRKVRAK